MTDNLNKGHKAFVRDFGVASARTEDEPNRCPECGGMGEDVYRRECRVCEGGGSISDDLLEEWISENGQFGVGA